MEFIDKAIEDYCLSHSSQEPEILQELNRETWLKVMFPRMLSGHFQGRLLSMISHMIKPSRILEIGTYTGYSSACLCEGLADGGLLHTIEINPELEGIIFKYLKLQNIEEKVKVHFGSALDIIPQLDTPFDLVFIDGDKEEYCSYFDLVFPRLNIGGYILADNVLWSGKVLDPLQSNDPETSGLLRFNAKVQATKGIEKVMLPVRDGIYLIRKTG